MSLIIPYKEKELYDNEGAFIKPDGEIIYTYGLHEKFSDKYCNGEEYEYLSRLKYGNTYDPNAFEYYKKEHNYQGKQEDIDVFGSTKLTSEQLKLYKLWLDEYEFSRRNLLSDFMVYLLSFDKVETVMRETITTTNPNPHIRFFNYYLMDWFSINQPPMKYNSKTGLFEYDYNNLYLGNSEDKEAEDEIKEIKARVLKKDRHLFFK